MGGVTCDEDPRAGQGQPGQVSMCFTRSGVVNIGHQVEVDPECSGAQRHGGALTMKRGNNNILTSSFLDKS